MTRHCAKRSSRRRRPFVRRRLQSLLCRERASVGCVPDADRMVPVAGGQAQAVTAPAHAWVEAVVARMRWRATQGDNLLTRRHIPYQHLFTTDGGQALARGVECQVPERVG